MRQKSIRALTRKGLWLSVLADGFDSDIYF